MTPSLLLCRVETAHRQTKAYLDIIERQIKARAERMRITTKAKARSHRHRRSRWTRSDKAMLRAYVEQLRFERRGEIEALSRKLTWQELAILAVREKTTNDEPTAKADALALL